MKLGLIAGNGRFPFLLLDAARAQGLSVVVSLVTAAKSNVLYVPNRAITRQGGKNYVTVRKNNVDSQVAITTGISNTQSTEVTSGLNEGDVIVLPTASTSSGSTPRPGGIRIPGLGG